jgi:hypothetical protein
MRFYAVPPHNQALYAVPPHNQTPIKSISSHLLWKSLLISHPCFKPFKTASEVSIYELWPLALLHVTPLAYLLAATVKRV